MKYQFFFKILAINICLASTLMAMDEKCDPKKTNAFNLITEDIQLENIEITSRNLQISDTKSATANIRSPDITSANSTPIRRHSAGELSDLIKNCDLDDFTNIKENKINNNNVDTTPCPPQSNTSSKSGYRLKSNTYTSLSINNLQEPNSEIRQKKSQSMPNPVLFTTEDSMIENNPKSPPATQEILAAPLAVQVAHAIEKTEERLNYLKNISQTFKVQSSEVENHCLCKHINEIPSKLFSSYDNNRLKEIFQSLSLDKLGIIFEDAKLVVLMRHGLTLEASKQGDGVINNSKADINLIANDTYTAQLNKLKIFATPMLHSKEIRAQSTALLISAPKNDLVVDSRLEELKFGESGTKDRAQLLQEKISEVKDNIEDINWIRTKGIDVAATLQTVASRIDSKGNYQSGLCVTHNSSLLCFYFSSWADINVSTSLCLLEQDKEKVNVFFTKNISKVKNIDPLSSFIMIIDKKKSNYVLLHNDPMKVEDLIKCMPNVKTAFQAFIEEKLGTEPK